jgi:ribosomal protein S27E
MLRVRCAVCGRLLAHRAGEASRVLTAHYAQEHAAVLGTAGNIEDQRR